MTHTMRTVAAALSLSSFCGLPVVLAQTGTQTAPPKTQTVKQPVTQPGTQTQTGTPARPAAAAPLAVLVTTVTPELMLAALQAAGYTGKLDKSGDNPEITLTRKNSADIYLNFYNCKTGSCTDMEAYTYYEADDLKTQPKLSDMGAWNSKHYTQAYINSDEGSVSLDSLYRFTGGFTRANFLNWLNEFRKDADAFDQMIDDLS